MGKDAKFETDIITYPDVKKALINYSAKSKLPP
ncbi:MAG: hypothetical protein ACI89T_000010 [Cognaticolwellia sp.]|jgi:hypothetical protein